MTVRIVRAHSVTRTGDNRDTPVLITGSHGGRVAACIALQAGFRAVVFNDASIGMDEAGIAGLRWLDDLRVPAVAVSYRTARIGNADETGRGTVSAVNASAAALGCVAGFTGADAATAMCRVQPFRGEVPVRRDTRSVLTVGTLKLAVVDSASAVEDGDEVRIVVTGSHGALLGEEPATALKINPRGAVFNDAGQGPDGRGTTRLPVLEARGVAAMTVDAATARIGDGWSTYNDGVISQVNKLAAACGAYPGLTAVDAIDRLQCCLVRGGE